MRLLFYFVVFAFCCSNLLGQSRKPLDHQVYDRWESIQGVQISRNGKWIAYEVNPQEGDGRLVIQSSDGLFTKEIHRGYAAAFTSDHKWLLCRIRPFFKETREAKIKKKKTEDMPKDSLALIQLGTDSIRSFPRLKSFQLADSTGQWLAWHSEKEIVLPVTPGKQDSATRVQTFLKLSDSLRNESRKAKQQYKLVKRKGFASLPALPKPIVVAKKEAEIITEGTNLFLLNLWDGTTQKFPLVKQYRLHPGGKHLLIEQTRKSGDTTTQAIITRVHMSTGKIDTILRRFNDLKQVQFDEPGEQLVFVTERDSSSAALKKHYGLWYYKTGMDSAQRIAFFKDTVFPSGKTISPDYAVHFSKNGKRIFLGLTPDRKVKDTSLVDFETSRLDIWHYQDPVLQPQQLVELQQELKRSYTAVFSPDASKLIPLGDESMEQLILPEADTAEWALGLSSGNYKMQDQWEMHQYKDLYAVNLSTGKKTLIMNQVRQQADISPEGRFVFWYDWKKKQYYTYEFATEKIIQPSSSIQFPLWNEEDDHPDDPPPYGSVAWTAGDSALLIYDKYDLWKVDPVDMKQPTCLTSNAGRKNRQILRIGWMPKDREFLTSADTLILTVLDENTKQSGLVSLALSDSQPFTQDPIRVGPHSVFGAPGILKAKASEQIIYTLMSPSSSPALYTMPLNLLNASNSAIRLSNINAVQKEYNWYTTELHRWKMFNGNMSEGILYKPQDFDSTKKYPLILYFYERNSNTLYNYKSPSPSASTINIPYFVSNGYLVFDPNIYYTNGEPGESAYNSVVSAARYLSKFSFVDSSRMAIQGQSWGGYQVAYIITRSNLFAAAGAGAPVVNMFSAYGGIRWGSGYSRQFQYEKAQSRIGYTPWQRPDLYQKNSPLFFADKVQTPLLMTHNDKDGAVPWYQGIEFFTALRRLGKKVWLLQYNEEDHNLVERRNRKDLSIRLAQYFDHYLKGAPMPVWMRTGVPAVEKGIEWGLKNE